MKYAPFIIVGILVAAIAVAVVARSGGERGAASGGPSTNRSAATDVPSAATNRPTVITADADGCAVIDLRDVPPTTHDQSKRVYAWIVEHPANAPCVRQFNPTIKERVVESRSEKIRDTNSWRLEFFY